MSKTFDNWNCIDPIPLGFLDRRIFTGEKVMLVHNVIHPNEVIPAHSHPHEQIFYVISGECDVTTQGKTEHLTAGGLALFPSDAEHAVTNTLDEDLVCIDIFAPIREDFLK